MIFDKKGTTTTVFQEDISLKGFLENLNKAYSKIKNDNLIINLFFFKNLPGGNLLEFLELSNKHKASNKSFVLVTNKLAVDNIPDNICVVPTLLEANDFISMEEIERDLDL